MSSNGQFDDDDFAKEAGAASGSRSFDEFECPDCSAHNVGIDTFFDKEEVRCMYCGSEFEARVSSEGKLKLKSA
ncbi:hypothetical protein D7Y13_11280 [Corallococcus praedator]|uniref:Uncharacterized protein n=2 Tax=Corallococcus TaxID=83461 RepID=A0ABX9QKB5_9BACT|nr:MULTISPECIES: hypothetical protein [Corallococcus]RKH16878.1 hypothetical protein D7X74_14095 [Corallococcus sp. CA047B]RKH18119.1 hypothetical protein D7X75_39825 [Corallococcus sp. CA031C]RKI11283.1 hypothetical protein D7Y13_11280 [Corallococcus praedator]